MKIFNNTFGKSEENGRYIVTSGSDDNPPKEFENPLEAWTYFIDLVDLAGRRRIGDMLQSQNKNRYTGEPNNDSFNL